MPDWKHWLEDRRTHRAPVDRFFDEAIAWLDQKGASTVSPFGRTTLELGPGHSQDISKKLIAKGIATHQADINPEMPGVRDISAEWNGEQRLPYLTSSFDAVLAREVIEHVEEIYEMVDEVSRIIKPGGRFWFSTPFIFPLHDYDRGDHWRLTPTAWAFLLRRSGFDHWEVEAADDRLLWDSWQYPVTILGWAER